MNPKDYSDSLRETFDTKTAYAPKWRQILPLIGLFAILQHSCDGVHFSQSEKTVQGLSKDEEKKIVDSLIGVSCNSRILEDHDYITFRKQIIQQLLENGVDRNHINEYFLWYTVDKSPEKFMAIYKVLKELGKMDDESHIFSKILAQVTNESDLTEKIKALKERGFSDIQIKERLSMGELDHLLYKLAWEGEGETKNDIYTSCPSLSINNITSIQYKLLENQHMKQEFEYKYGENGDETAYLKHYLSLFNTIYLDKGIVDADGLEELVSISKSERDISRFHETCKVYPFFGSHVDLYNLCQSKNIEIREIYELIDKCKLSKNDNNSVERIIRLLTEGDLSKDQVKQKIYDSRESMLYLKDKKSNFQGSLEMLYYGMNLDYIKAYEESVGLKASDSMSLFMLYSYHLSYESVDERKTALKNFDTFCKENPDIDRGFLVVMLEDKKKLALYRVVLKMTQAKGLPDFIAKGITRSFYYDRTIESKNGLLIDPQKLLVIEKLIEYLEWEPFAIYERTGFYKLADLLVENPNITVEQLKGIHNMKVDVDFEKDFIAGITQDQKNRNIVKEYGKYIETRTTLTNGILHDIYEKENSLYTWNGAIEQIFSELYEYEHLASLITYLQEREEQGLIPRIDIGPYEIKISLSGNSASEGLQVFQRLLEQAKIDIEDKNEIIDWGQIIKALEKKINAFLTEDIEEEDVFQNAEFFLQFPDSDDKEQDHNNAFRGSAADLTDALTIGGMGDNIHDFSSNNTNATTFKGFVKEVEASFQKNVIERIKNNETPKYIYVFHGAHGEDNHTNYAKILGGNISNDEYEELFNIAQGYEKDYPGIQKYLKILVSSCNSHNRGNYNNKLPSAGLVLLNSKNHSSTGVELKALTRLIKLYRDHKEEEIWKSFTALYDNIKRGYHTKNQKYNDFNLLLMLSILTNTTSLVRMSFYDSQQKKNRMLSENIYQNPSWDYAYRSIQG